MQHTQRRSYDYSKSNHKKTLTQKRREAYDYRHEYLKRNPGLFGCMWFCSQCGKPILGKGSLQVDHIMPLNKGGINRTFNTVAICPTCNSKKSDTVDLRVAKGYAAKIFEVIAFTAQKVVITITFCAFSLLSSIAKILFGIIFSPLKGGNFNKNSLIAMIAITVMICVIFIMRR